MSSVFFSNLMFAHFTSFNDFTLNKLGSHLGTGTSVVLTFQKYLTNPSSRLFSWSVIFDESWHCIKRQCFKVVNIQWEYVWKDEIAIICEIAVCIVPNFFFFNFQHDMTSMTLVTACSLSHNILLGRQSAQPHASFFHIAFICEGILLTAFFQPYAFVEMALFSVLSFYSYLLSNCVF